MNPGPHKLGQLAEIARTEALDAFVLACGGWALVGPPPHGLGDWTFKTDSLRSIRDDSGGQPVLVDENFVVFFLKKQKPGPFADTVLVGRAASNDVIIMDAAVSKLHARVTKKDGTYTLTDAGSSHGTFVDGRRLQPDERHALRPADMVGFGQSHFHVFTEERLHRVLKKLWDV